MKNSLSLGALGLVSVSMLGGLGIAEAPAASAATAATSTASNVTTYVKTVQSGINLNVRSGPGTTYAISGSLPGGTKIQGTMYNATWFKITTGSYAGKYVSNDYLKTVSSFTTAPPPVAPAPAPVAQATTTAPTTQTSTTLYKRVSTSNTIIVRSSPSNTGAYVDEIVSGAYLVGKNYNSSWFQITQGIFAGKYVSNASLTSVSSAPTMPTTEAGKADLRNALVSTAAKYAGKPYIWGAANPAMGFDCSGLTSYVMAQNGITIPRNSSVQYQKSQHITADQAKAGDLIFMKNASGGIYHVVIIADPVKKTYWGAPEPGRNVSMGSYQYNAPNSIVFGSYVGS